MEHDIKVDRESYYCAFLLCINVIKRRMRNGELWSTWEFFGMRIKVRKIHYFIHYFIHCFIQKFIQSFWNSVCAFQSKLSSVSPSTNSRINFRKASSLSDNKNKARSKSIKNSTFNSLNSGHNSSTIRL